MTLLKVDKLSKQFGGLMAVQKLSFTVNQGEVFAIIGPNGAGKTTTLNMLSGLLMASSGAIYLNDKDISQLDAAARCQLGLGRAFQVVQPFEEMTVEDNVMVGALFGSRQSKAEALKNSHAVLEQTGLLKLKDTVAEDLTLLQEKRLEIARALATRPSLLLLDEVMAGLRPKEAQAAVGLIKDVNASGVTIIFIEHVMPVVRDLADRVLVMDYGTPIAEGSYQQVTRNPQVIQAYLGVDEDDEL